MTGKFAEKQSWRYMVIRIEGMDLDFVMRATGGMISGNHLYPYISGISTDTRSIEKDELFLALKGESFDGHDYAAEALNRGASGVIAEKPLNNIEANSLVIEVPSTLSALGNIANAWRMRYEDLKLVAITGSNGKTTTKEMISCVLSSRYKIIKNKGNLNNLIGLPLTLLGIKADHDIAVVELGMNTFGEIRKLTEICCPDIGIITNIGKAHIGNLGGIEGVKKAKAELVDSFDKTDKIFMVNTDDIRVAEVAERIDCKKITYGLNGNPDYKAYDIRRDSGGYLSFKTLISGEPTDIKIRTIGLHNVLNALCAISVGGIFELTSEQIKDSLENFNFPKMRLEILKSNRGFTIINDSYNANPDSTRRALGELVEIKGRGRAIAVLGDMLELGEMSDTEHRNIGKCVSELGVDYLFSTGVHGRAIYEAAKSSVKSLHSEDQKELSDAILEVANRDDVVLVKGSRGMKMENIVKYLEAGR